jgi:hypothetical protein
MTDTAVKELVARLRDEQSDGWSGDAWAVSSKLADEAASMLTTLSEERDEARARVLELEKVLEVCRAAIRSLPPDALGMAEVESVTSERRFVYPIRNELLGNIEEVLRARSTLEAGE